MATIFPLNKPQFEFLQMPHKYRAMVSGYGVGKTWCACAGFLQHFLQFPMVQAGYFAPTYSQIADIFYPTISEAYESTGYDVEVLESKKIVNIYDGKRQFGRIICRSMEKPSSIVGFKIGYAVTDEIDTMPTEKAKQAWRKIQARMRYKVAGLKNGIDVTTTPEGFKWVWWQFVDEVQRKPELEKLYGLLQASTYDNAANLPDDYIPSLVASYPESLIDAYLRGQFTNLNSGTVYSNFDRKLNSCDVEMSKDDTVLHIGMDFNVTNMAAAVNVIRNGRPYAVDEIVNAYDTPNMIRMIKERYWKYNSSGDYQRTKQIIVYPDASGASRKSVNASETDISLLRQAGFQVIANNSNPPVKNRILSLNAMFLNGEKERRLMVNRAKCPTLTSCLEKQAWGDNGEPLKSGNYDHINDAQGYFIYQTFPINFTRTYTVGTSTRR